MIYQVHHKHGKHIAYTLQEAERNHKMGWRDVSEEEFYGKTAPVSQEIANSEEAPQANGEAPKKRGRKPKVDGNGN